MLPDLYLIRITLNPEGRCPLVHREAFDPFVQETKCGFRQGFRV